MRTSLTGTTKDAVAREDDVPEQLATISSEAALFALFDAEGA